MPDAFVGVITYAYMSEHMHIHTHFPTTTLSGCGGLDWGGLDYGEFNSKGPKPYFCMSLSLFVFICLYLSIFVFICLYLSLFVRICFVLS